MVKKRSYWNSRLGLYLAAVGTSFGLGNLWRFPYVISENDGGGFLLLYIFVMAVVGLPILIAEFILGKWTERGLVESVGLMTLHRGLKASNRYLTLSKIPIIVNVILMAYYAVISGWVLYFGMQFLVQIFGVVHGDSVSISKFLMTNGILQLALVSVHLLLACTVVAKGLQDGLEKWVSYLVPFFAVSVLILVTQSLSLESAQESLRFLFYPNFSKLTSSSLGDAIGHALFTMSLGVGTMVTFGSYMREEDKISSVSLRVAAADVVMSIMAGLLIFPILFAAGREVTGPTMFFESIPNYFLQIKWGVYFGFFFFICLYMASLGSTIALLETVVANVTEHKRIGRNKALWWVGGVVFLLSIIPALSSALTHLLSYDVNLFVWIDNVLINWFLPIGALGVLVVVAYNMKDEVRKQLFVDERQEATFNLYKDWLFALKWICPLVIIAGLLLQIYSLF